MKITELNGQLAKISRSSITVKDDTGKTKGVITRCYELAPRDSSDIWCKVRKAVGVKATSYINEMRKINNDIWYLYNINVPDENISLLKGVGINIAEYRKLA